MCSVKGKTETKINTPFTCKSSKYNRVLHPPCAVGSGLLNRGWRSQKKDVFSVSTSG